MSRDGDAAAGVAAVALAPAAASASGAAAGAGAVDDEADDGLLGASTLFDGAAGDTIDLDLPAMPDVGAPALTVSVACDGDTATAAQSGASLWPGCAGLCRYLHEHWDDEVMQQSGGGSGPTSDASEAVASLGAPTDGLEASEASAVKAPVFVELGCGVGMAGIFAALRAGHRARVVCTDHSATVLETAADNADANGVGGRVLTRHLEWTAEAGSALAVELGETEGITHATALLASECVFAPKIVAPLLECVAALLRGLGCSPSAGAFYLGSSFRSAEADEIIAAESDRLGLVHSVLRRVEGEHAATFLLVEKFALRG